jgi:hypothetical protein
LAKKTTSGTKTSASGSSTVAEKMSVTKPSAAADTDSAPANAPDSM